MGGKYWEVIVLECEGQDCKDNVLKFISFLMRVIIQCSLVINLLLSSLHLEIFLEQRSITCM